MGAPHHQRPPAAYQPVPRDIPGRDVELVHRTQAGDREAFAELYALTVDRVTRYVAVRLRDRDRDAVEDVVQDAFCDALADPSLIEPDALGSLLRLAARACTRHQWSRRRYVRAALTLGEDQQTDRDHGPHTAGHAPVPATPPRITFAHALAGLTPDQRRAVHLRLLDGYPRDTAARLMGRSVVAVRALEQRALRRLQVHLAAPNVVAEDVPGRFADRFAAAPANAVLAR